MLLLYEDFSFKEDIFVLTEEWNKILRDLNLNESAINALLQKGSNLLGFISDKSTWLKDVLDDPKKLLNRKGVMSDNDFEEFAKAYSEIYDDLDDQFIKRHKKSFDIINQIVRTYIASKKLEVEIATRQEKLDKYKEEERLAGISAEDLVASARSKRQKQEDRIAKMEAKRRAKK